MIDVHCHLLPAFDDGARSLETADAMVRLAVEDGITHIVCTPHLRDDFPGRMPFAAAPVRGALQGRIRRAGLPLELVEGAEVGISSVPLLDHAELRAAAIGGPGEDGATRYVLVETPYYGWPPNMEQVLFDMRVRGLWTVLAHPERNEEVQDRPERVGALVEAGALVQITAASITGRFGPEARRCALRLWRQGWAHVIATDAHSARGRPPLLRPAVEELKRRFPGGVDPDWAVTDGPAAILTGTPTEPPVSAPRGRLARVLRRS